MVSQLTARAQLCAVDLGSSAGQSLSAQTFSLRSRRLVTHVVRRPRQAMPVNDELMTRGCSARMLILGRRCLTCCAPGDGSGATGCGSGGRAAALDVGSISAGAAASGERAMLGLCIAPQRARVERVASAAACIRQSGRDLAAAANLWSREHLPSCAIAFSSPQMLIRVQYMLIGAVGWGWSLFMRPIAIDHIFGRCNLGGVDFRSCSRAHFLCCTKRLRRTQLLRMVGSGDPSLYSTKRSMCVQYS